MARRNIIALAAACVLAIVAIFLVVYYVLVDTGSNPITRSPGNVVLTVEQALAAEEGQMVNVSGAVVATADRMVLASALLESYPPQAGKPSLSLKGLDLKALVGLSSSTGRSDVSEVTWTDYWVVLTGVIENGVLLVQSTPRVIEAEVADLKVRFSPVSEPISAGDQVWWALDVMNTGQSAVELTFASGQRGDVVLSQAGREKYRWSAGKFFAEAIETVSLKAGENLPVVLNDKIAVPAGEYDLTAIVTAVAGADRSTTLPELRTVLRVH